MPSMIHKEKFEMRTGQGGRGWLWLGLPFILLGYLACTQLFSLASRFHNSGLVVIVGALVAVPALFVLALALTWLYQKTGNLLASITAHACFNAVNLALLLLLPNLSAT